MKQKTKKIIKITCLSIIALFFLIGTVITVAFVSLNVKTNNINDDYSLILKEDKYKTKVSVSSVEVFKQKVSCGYAVIEMFSKWDGGTTTEDSMYDEYGKVVTSTGKSFCDEFNKQNSNYQTTMHSYLKNSELISKVYDSLASGVPVPLEWAAKLEDEWTLHYSLVTGMDVSNDQVTVTNPYGYIENITFKEFISRTTFEAFENMPLIYGFGFVFGVFEKNTIFIPVHK